MTNPDYKLSSDQYKAKVNTPATSPEYFETFIKPLIDKVLQTKADCHLVDIACGHAHAMNFAANHPSADSIKVTGVDLSESSLTEARTTFAKDHPQFDITFIQADAENPLPELENSADAATAINAMAYKQAQMLKTLFNTLKPGAKCVINFFIPSKNQPYIEFYAKHGCKVSQQTLSVNVEGKETTYPLTVTDFSQMEHEMARKLGQQSFISDLESIEALCKLVGFEITDHHNFQFLSPAFNAIIDNDVYVLQKPLTAGIEQPLKNVHDKIVNTMKA